MEVWRRFYCLSSGERTIVLEAAGALGTTWLGLRLAGFQRWHWLLSQKACLAFLTTGISASCQPAINQFDSQINVERSRNPSAPVVDSMTPQDSLLSLVANSYATRLLSSDMRAHEFRFLGRMILRVPAFRVRSHEEPARIDRLCELICEALPKLQDSSSSSLKCSTSMQA
jgi:hypothetical protein